MHGRVVELVLRGEQHSAGPPSRADTLIAAVIFPESLAPIAKAFWQHTGDGISSRRAEFCLKAFQDGHITPRDHVNQGLSTPNPVQKGPRRYQRGASIDKGDPLRQDSTTADSQLDASSTTEKGDYSQFVEERFGRNLDLSLTNQAKVAIRRRIAGSLTADVDLKEALNIPGHPDVTRKVEGFSEDDVYLFPAGMSAIYNMHRILLKARGPLKSISFG
jgi:cystathionine gamma-synthase